MDAFRKYRQGIPAAHHRPCGRCAVCGGQPTLVRQQFAGLAGRSWNAADIGPLTKAAQSALR